MINKISRLVNYLRLVKIRKTIIDNFKMLNAEVYSGNSTDLTIEYTDILNTASGALKLTIESNIGALYTIKEFKGKLLFTLYMGSAVDLIDANLLTNLGIVSNLLNSYNNMLDTGVISLQPNLYTDLGLYVTTTVRWKELNSASSIGKLLKEMGNDIELATKSVLKEIKMIQDMNSLDEEFNISENDEVC